MTSGGDPCPRVGAQATGAPGAEHYDLTLFVSGASDSSAQAIANVRVMCDAYLGGRHVLKVVDLHQNPALAAEHRVRATPTLVKAHPLPVRMLVGDMSDYARLLAGLDVDLKPRLALGTGVPDPVKPALRR
jgi:circadian clock protein KaiB